MWRLPDESAKITGPHSWIQYRWSWFIFARNSSSVKLHNTTAKHLRYHYNSRCATGLLMQVLASLWTKINRQLPLEIISAIQTGKDCPCGSLKNNPSFPHNCRNTCHQELSLEKQCCLGLSKWASAYGCLRIIECTCYIHHKGNIC